MQVPCKECKDRSATCHGECERYQAFYNERLAYRKKCYLQREADISLPLIKRKFNTIMREKRKGSKI